MTGKRLVRSRHRRACGSSPRSRGKTARKQTQNAKLSRADIANLAEQMQIPEGILRLALARYPELARPLARHRDLAA